MPAMLKIRLQRVGRKHEPTFRVVLTDSKNGPQSGKFQEILGFYDPRKQGETLKGDRITHWMSVGAQVSTTVHNLLVRHKIVEGKTKNPLPRKAPYKSDKKLALEKALEEKRLAEEKARADALAAAQAAEEEAKAKAEAEAAAAAAPAEELAPAPEAAPEPAPAEEAPAPEAEAPAAEEAAPQEDAAPAEEAPAA